MDLLKIKELLPLASLTLLIGSSIKLIAYYQVFNIHIFEYLELSEIIFSFLDDLYGYSNILFIALFGWILNDFYGKKIDTDNVKDRTLVYTTVMGIIFINLIVNILKIPVKNDANVYIFGNLLLVIVLAYISYHSSKYPTYTKYFAFFLYSLAFFHFSANKEGIDVKDNHKYKKVSLTFETKKIYSDSCHYFVGQTKNFTFFYSPSEKETTIYKNEYIKRIDIKK